MLICKIYLITRVFASRDNVDYWNRTHLRHMIEFYVMLGLRHGKNLQLLNTIGDQS